MSLTSARSVQGPSLRAMAGIEARRFARHPMFLLACAATFGLFAALPFIDGGGHSTDLLSWPVIPAFFIGLSSLVVAARQTRSTEGADEAMLTVPGTEGRRTLALALACLVPFAAGVVALAEMFVVVSIWEPHPQEWWFGTAPATHVLSVLVASGPVACLGGGLLGVLTGRWLRFPGAPAVAVIVVVLVTILGQYPADRAFPQARLWTPWTLFHSGTFEDGTQVLYAGSGFFYLLYALCLCASAVLAAVWHDRTARTPRLIRIFAGVVVVGLISLGLAMTTGIEENRRSDPLPAEIRQ